MVTTAKFQFKGFDEYLEKLTEKNADIDAVVAGALKEGGNVLRRGMRRRAPKDTHRLEDHIQMRQTRDGNLHQVEVGLIHEKAYTPADVGRYGNAQEYGTSTMAAHPYIRPTIDEDMSLVKKVIKAYLEKAGMI